MPATTSTATASAASAASVLDHSPSLSLSPSLPKSDSPPLSIMSRSPFSVATKAHSHSPSSPARQMTSISRNNLHFVVFDAPSDSTLPLYLAELSARSVSHIVRVSEMPTYSAAAVADLAPSISVVDLPFPDGSVPPPHTITAFLDLCQSVFPGGLTNKQQICGDDITSPPQRAIGVHCIAGLGRAPMLVAIALIESGMSALEAVEYVRVRRRGAFNSVQLRFLVDEYKPSYAKNLARKNLLLSSFSFGVHSNGKRESDESLRAVFASSSSSSSSVGAATAGMHGKSNGGFKAFWNNVVGRKTPPVSA